MSKDEIIIRQAERIIELEDKLAEVTETKNFFYNEYDKLRVNSIPVEKIPKQEAPQCPTMV